MFLVTHVTSIYYIPLKSSETGVPGNNVCVRFDSLHFFEYFVRKGLQKLQYSMLSNKMPLFYV